MEMQELKQILETLKNGDGHFFKKQYEKDGFTISISNFFVGERYEVTVWWTVTTKKTYLSDTKKLLHSEVVNDSQTFHVPLQKKKLLGLIPQTNTVLKRNCQVSLTISRKALLEDYFLAMSGILR